ncbi:MAG: GNAT family N-acetyltransferase [Bacteroidota bacterium]|nr:GNAT family N-acetyltransferase [Bacteroidota bacterium]
MIILQRTDSSNPDFINLVKQLDALLAAIDGEDHLFYNALNTLGSIKHAVIVYADNNPVACGAMKDFNSTAMEVKRMFTLPEWRGRGLASQVLNELEIWTKELGYPTCILETGNRQPEAIALYQKCGYRRIANYGQYEGIENSVCFEKRLQ